MDVRVYRRVATIIFEFLPLLIAYALNRTLGNDADTRREQAIRLRETLVELGPTFIKLGQVLSTRPDILPGEFIEELEALQDDVPPAPWPEARALIERELGPVGTRFDAFDIEPISGASLAQVYRAEVDGETVAVKVQRPNLADRVETDLVALEKLLSIGMRFLDENQAYSVENLISHFQTTLEEEMDYEREATMLRAIRTNYVDDDRVRIPRVVGGHSTDSVLTLEFVAGTKITDVATLDEQGIDRDRLARDVHQLYLEMVLVDGIYHGDPHPGNLAVQPDGTAVLYDFGMSEELDDRRRQQIIDFYLSVGTQDPDRIMEALVEIGTVHEDVLSDARAEMTALLANEIERAQDGTLSDSEFEDLVADVESAMYKTPFRLPEDMAMVMRVLAIGEGIFETLHPDFDMVASTAEFLATHDIGDPEDLSTIMEQGLSIDATP